MEKLSRRSRLICIITGFFGSSLLWFTGIGSNFDLLIANHLFQKIGTRFRPSPELVLVVIDDASLQMMEPRVGRWPWPRSQIARLVDACEGAAAMGLDVLFLERDRVDPRNDESLALALQRNGRAVLAGVFVEDMVLDPPETESSILRKSLAAFPAGKNLKIQKLGQQFLLPIPQLAKAAALLGHANFFPASDRLLRSYPYFIVTNQGWMPSLAAATLAATGRAQLAQPDISHELLFYHQPFRRYSAWDVLRGPSGNLPEGWANGKILLLGVEAEGLHDLRATPMSGRMSGLEIHAIALSNLLQQTWLRPIPSLAALVMGILLSLIPSLFWTASLRSVLFRWALALAGYGVLAGGVFYGLGLRMPWAAPCIGFVAAASARLIATARHERNLRRRIEELDQMKRMLGSMLVHDLKSPLNSMVMLLQSIAPNASMDPKTRRRLEMALGEGGRLSDLIHSLLDIHRMEEQRMRLIRSRFLWDELLKETVARLAPKAERLQLAVEIRPGPSVEIHGDRHLLGRVIGNLLENALAFSPHGAVIVCENGIDPQNETALLARVSNHGPVLDPQLQEKIFEMFVQGRADGRREGRGFGLGLAFCKLAIIAHGGRVDCISPAPFWKDGVCMEIRLPLETDPMKGASGL